MHAGGREFELVEVLRKRGVCSSVTELSSAQLTMLPQMMLFQKQQDQSKCLLVSVHDAEEVARVMLREVLAASASRKSGSATHRQNISKNGMQNRPQLLLGNELDQMRPVR